MRASFSSGQEPSQGRESLGGSRASKERFAGPGRRRRGGRGGGLPGRLVGLLAFSLAWFVSMNALAQRVVLVRQDSDSVLTVEALHRLSGELKVHDFHVVLVSVDDSAPLSPDRLAEIAEREQAVACVAFVTGEGHTTADIWLSDRVTGKTSIRTLATEHEQEAPSVLAIRAVDLLRVSLREATSERPIPPEVVGAHPERAPPRVLRWARADEPERLFQVRLEAAALTPLRQWSPGLGLAASLSRRLAGPLEARAFFAGPSQGGDMQGPIARARLRQTVGLGELGAGWTWRETWTFETSVGVGVHHLDVSGEADSPHFSAAGSALSLAVGAGAGVGFVVAPGVSVGASVRSLFINPAPVILFGDEQQPFGVGALVGSAGLRVGF